MILSVTNAKTIIFRNLPLSNTNFTNDVIYFINNALGVSMSHRDLVACHELGAVRNPLRPPPIIAKFNNFKKSDLGPKKFIKKFPKPS